MPKWSGSRPPNWVLGWLNREQYNDKRTKGTLRHYIQAYLANVSEMDFSLGRLLSNLKKWCPNAVIMFTSDHGYSLGDHNHIAKFTLWDQAGRVPLLIHDPLGAPITRGRAVHDTVSLIDLAPTILDYAGLPAPDEMDGMSLKPYVDNPSLRRNWAALTTMFGSVSMRTNGYRYTRYTDGSEEFFVIADDPDQSQNLIDSAQWQGVVSALRDRFDWRLRAWMTSDPKCIATMSAPWMRNIKNICPPIP